MGDIQHQAVEQIHPGRPDNVDNVAEQPQATPGVDSEVEKVAPLAGLSSPLLPDIPSGDLSLDIDLSSIVASTAAADSPDFQKLQKRASNVMKLTEENDKLKAELRAMTARLEAAERRKTELRIRSQTQQIMEPPSS